MFFFLTIYKFSWFLRVVSFRDYVEITSVSSMFLCLYVFYVYILVFFYEEQTYSMYVCMRACFEHFVIYLGLQINHMNVTI